MRILEYPLAILFFWLVLTNIYLLAFRPRKLVVTPTWIEYVAAGAALCLVVLLISWASRLSFLFYLQRNGPFIVVLLLADHLFGHLFRPEEQRGLNSERKEPDVRP